MPNPPQARERVDVEGLREDLARLRRLTERQSRIERLLRQEADELFGRAIRAEAEIAPLKAAVEVARGALEWRPIETAPNDASMPPKEFLVAGKYPDSDEWWRTIGRWTFDGPEMRRGSWNTTFQPTLWMHIPALNAATLSGETGK